MLFLDIYIDVWYFALTFWCFASLWLSFSGVSVSNMFVFLVTSMKNMLLMLFLSILPYFEFKFLWFVIWFWSFLWFLSLWFFRVHSNIIFHLMHYYILSIMFLFREYGLCFYCILYSFCLVIYFLFFFCLFVKLYFAFCWFWSFSFFHLCGYMSSPFANFLFYFSAIFVSNPWMTLLKILVSFL